MLAGANVLTGSVAIMSFSSLAVVMCLSGLIFITFLNSERQLLPKLTLPDEMEFSKKEEEFLQSLIDLPSATDAEIETIHLDEKVEERVFIRGRYYRDNPEYQHNIADRVANLETLLSGYARSMIAVVLQDTEEESSLSRRILKEIQDLFIPKFPSKSSEDTLCYYLNKCSEILQHHSCADFLILILENPGISHSIIQYLIDAFKDDVKGSYRLQSMLSSFNLWMHGFFLSENYEGVLKNYNRDLLTEEERSYIQKGNFIQLICNQISPQLLDQFLSLLSVPVESLSVLECCKKFTGINSDGYVKNDPSLRVVIDELNLRMSFCLNLPAVSSWSFRFVLAKNLSSILELSTFISQNRSVLMNNFFLLIEFLYSHKKYQSFIRGILHKAMPLSSWETLLHPIVHAIFDIGMVSTRELEVMASHLGIRFLDLTEIISSSRFLSQLLPDLFPG